MQEVDLGVVNRKMTTPCATVIGDATTVVGCAMDETPLDAYRRVMLDHTELITRISRLEDRSHYQTCGWVANVLMIGMIGLWLWLSASSQ